MNYSGKKIKTFDLLYATLCLVVIAMGTFGPAKLHWFAILAFCFVLITIILKYTRPHWRIFNPYGNKAPAQMKEMFLNDKGIFNYTGDGFTISLKAKEVSFNWSDITRVTAYKKDLYAVDEIYLSVLGANGTGFTVSESTLGWYPVYPSPAKAACP